MDHRAETGLAFAGFVVIGLGGGASGVLLPAQIAQYGVDKSVIGVLFFGFSAGYLLAGAVSGTLMSRFGPRGELVLGTAIYAAMAFASGLRPQFPVLIAVTAAYGFGGGVVESVLNTYLSALPRPVVLLNLLHACYGVGALAGPVLAASVLAAGYSWGTVYLIFGVCDAVLLVGFALRYPDTLPGGTPEPEPTGAPPRRGDTFRATLRHPAVLLAGLFLAIYVGVEIGLGNWLYSLLVEERGQGPLLAGWVVSAYWFGFTLGRFVLSVLAERFGVGPAAFGGGCLVVILLAEVAVWLLPGVAATSVGLVILGFALGPIYPLTVAVLPRMTPASLVPTAIGLLVGMSVLGGAFFPWLAGTFAERLGLASLLPFTLLLSAILFVNWWRLVRRMA